MSTLRRHHMGMHTKTTIGNVIIYVILIVMSIVWLLPFCGILLESFRCESQGKAGYVIPHEWGLNNYIYLLFGDPENLSSFGNTEFVKWYGNTLLVGVSVAIIQTIMVLAMSYTLSRLRFKGRKLLMNVMLVLGMFPGFLTMIVLYKVLSGLNLTSENAPYGLILIYTASSGMGYYVSKGFFDTIPKSLDEAARVDGANRFQVFYKIIMPLSKPIVIYTILTAFMAPWGDFMFAKYISHNSSAGMNVAVGLQGFTTFTSIGSHYTYFCAGGVLVAVPITILFMCLQKYYVEGVTGGAVKG